MKKKNKGFTLIELLAVIVILAIVLGIGVGAYQKYLVSSRNKSYNIAENSMKNSAMSAISDCLTGNGKNREFCQEHEVPEDQYDYELIYLSELTNDDYINPIKDPYNTDKLCSEQSYVYMRNKADTEVENNSDIEYKVCLICSNYKSKDCLDDIGNQESNYNAYCKISYDEAGTNPYDGKWTDQNLYLTLTAEGDFKYGISYFLYKIGSGKENRIGATDNKVVLPLTSTVDNQEIKVTAQDGLGNKVTTTCGARVKIDKTKLISAKLEGKLATKKTTIKSNDWASEDVLLTVTPNPKKMPSGYYYQWYKDGVKLGNETTSNTYTASTAGTYKVEVTNGLRNQTVTTNEFIVKFDRVAPTITIKVDPLITDSKTYSFVDNTTSTFGVGGGATTCTPASSNKYSEPKEYKVTCTALGNNKLSATKSFTAIVDDKDPTISAINNPKSLGKQDYDFLKNVTYNLGVAGGTVTCNPAASKKTGNYSVTCTATKRTGRTAKVTFNVRHSYAATKNTDTKDATCKDECQGEQVYCCPAVAAKCPGTYPPGSGDCACNCNATTCTPSATCCDGDYEEVCRCPEGYSKSGDDKCTKTWYTCPNGGTLSGTTCVY